jgi:hypothetical protein
MCINWLINLRWPSPTPIMGLSHSFLVLFLAQIYRSEFYFHVQATGMPAVDAERYRNVCDPGFVPHDNHRVEVLEVSNH